jgi:hypothetical protein
VINAASNTASPGGGLAPRQFELFTNSCRQEWLPDETVFSWAGRYHSLSGNAAFRITGQQLFGDGRSGFLHDFPEGLDHFAQATQGHLGSASTIALNHTVFPYYLLFRPLQHRSRAMSTLRSGRIAELKERIGVAPIRFGGQCSMKACRGCIEIDRRTHGLAYWHVTHQLPGVWWCPVHGIPLMRSKRSTADRDRYRWFMPSTRDVEPEDAEFASALPEAAKRTLAALARVTISALASADKFVFDPNRLAETYRLVVARRGSRPDSPDLETEFCRATDPLHVVSELTEIGTHTRNGTSQILRLLQERVGGSSLHHFVLITWLFGSWEEFFGAYENIPT